MNSRKEKVALITGAGSGIGRAVALKLAENGVHLCIAGRNTKKLESVATIANKYNIKIICCPVDLTIDADVRRIAKQVEDEFSCLDILIHSAGVISMGLIESTSVEELDRQYQTNVRAPYVLTQALLPMLKSRQGQIVFLNSSVFNNAGAKIGPYAATKFALKAIADSLRHEVNKDGVRVLSIFPGRTASPMQESVYRMEGRKYHPGILMQPEDVADVIWNALVLPGSAEITDINLRPLVKSY